MRPGGAGVSRRGVLVSLLGLATTGLPSLATADGGVYVVSRERLLQKSAPTARLREAEVEMTAALQAEIDRVKAALAAEEADLARVRDTATESEMARRGQDFDRRFRLARRIAQERASAVQLSFQEARAALVASLPAVLDALRRDVGASVILNADQTLAFDPAADITDRAIALFNARVPVPQVRAVDLSFPPLGPEASDENGG